MSAPLHRRHAGHRIECIATRWDMGDEGSVADVALAQMHCRLPFAVPKRAISYLTDLGLARLVDSASETK